MEKFFNVQEVAKIYGVSRRTIYRLIEEGELQYLKIRRSVRIPESEVIRYGTKLKKNL